MKSFHQKDSEVIKSASNAHHFGVTMPSQFRLGYVIIYVEDILKTLAFYKKAFEVEPRFLDESHQYAELKTGSTTTLAFAQELFIKESHDFQRNRQTGTPPGIEIAWIVNDVEKAFEKAIEAGAVEILKPKRKTWGQMVSYVRDNNGVLVEICDAIDGSKS